MSTGDESSTRQLLEAVAFAGRAHRGQLRKDGETPYFSHVVRVCLVVRHVFGLDDAKVLMAAVLHDTVEDTTTDYDDLSKRFGADVSQWVASLSKDKRLPEEEREKAYGEQLANGPWQVQVCKLADIYDNLMDAGPQQWPRTLRNSRRYLEVLRPKLAEAARRPWQLVFELVARLETEQATTP
jgi:guanosine-3',5'-bis(diphosphate) 3'-pyrophosphohydrolase